MTLQECVTFAIGTTNELLGDLEGQLAPVKAQMHTLGEQQNWEEYDRVLREEYIPATNEFLSNDKSYMVHTAGYITCAAVVSLISPMVGVPLATDALLRLYRNAFAGSVPVGIVGTIREGYEKLKKRRQTLS